MHFNPIGVAVYTLQQCLAAYDSRCNVVFSTLEARAMSWNVSAVLVGI